jgi:hypothetical protein
MALDDQQPISNKFNREASLIAIEKRAIDVQFNQKEEKKYFEIRQNYKEEPDKEDDAFKKDYKLRLQKKEQELTANKTPYWDEIKSEAKRLVRLDHEEKIQSIHNHYIEDMTTLVERAEERTNLQKKVIAQAIKRKQDREIKERLSRLPEKNRKDYHDKKKELKQNLTQEEKRQQETADKRINLKFDDLREKEHHQSNPSREPKTQSEKELLVQASNEIKKEDQEALKEVERENNKALMALLERARIENLKENFNEKSRDR